VPACVVLIGLAWSHSAASWPPTDRRPLLSQVGTTPSIPLLCFSPGPKWSTSMRPTTGDHPASCPFASPPHAYKRCHTSTVPPRAHLCYQLHSSPCRHSSRRALPTTTIPHCCRPFSTAVMSILGASEDPLSLLSLPMLS
jgi:hypothetical protein